VDRFQQKYLRVEGFQRVSRTWRLYGRMWAAFARMGRLEQRALKWDRFGRRSSVSWLEARRDAMLASRAVRDDVRGAERQSK
jgi:hypothetical protein